MRAIGNLVPAARAGGLAFCLLGALMIRPALAQTTDAPAAAAPRKPVADLGGQSNGLSEGVVVTGVNDGHDLPITIIIQRMRLLIVTSGIQPTQQNIPALQQEAARSLIDEHLEMQELKEES